MQPFMADVKVILGLALSQVAHASPQWHHWGPPAGYNDSCRAAAPYVSALRQFDAASSLCSSVLSLTAQITTDIVTELASAALNISHAAPTASYIASASAIRRPIVTVTENSTTTTVYSNNTITRTRVGSLETAPTSTSYTTLTSTATICGDSSQASNFILPAKRPMWRPGGVSQVQSSQKNGQKAGWKTPNDLASVLEDLAEIEIAYACSCMSLPVQTQKYTGAVRPTPSGNTTRYHMPSASATPNTPLTWANTSTIHPVVTRTAILTRTIRSSLTITPIITLTVYETTTVLVGQQYGVPTVVLASPTPITSIDANGLATQDYDDERYPISLPFPISAYGISTRIITVSVNGWIALSNDSGTTEHYAFDNSPLPRLNSDDDFGLPDTVFLPYWNDLFIAQSTAQGLYYEITGTGPRRNVSFEWYTSLYQQPTGYYHFIATFQEARPGAVIYTYYQANGEVPLNTAEHGTIGVQSFLADHARQYSYDRLVEPGLEITYDPVKDAFLRTNAVNCVVES